MAEKLALVTGASSGIGYWLAKELGKRGYDLVVCSAGERLDGAAALIQGTGDVNAISSDLATRDGIDHLWKSVMDQAVHSTWPASMRASVSVDSSQRRILRPS